ncbi:MAG: hypothetical protein IPK19_00915 [Chloroflexi bacterium]|nr:hypothetical protein [Chloroflexota bacterium]
MVQVWYIPTAENEGVNTLGSLIRDRLEAVSAVGVPFEVMAATKKARTITVGILVESDYAVDPVVADTQAALEAALLPEVLGIGATLFRSKVLAVAGAVEGVAAPLDVFVGSKLMEKAGIKAGAGKYFEFTVVISAKVEQANRAKGGAVVGDIAP